MNRFPIPQVSTSSDGLPLALADASTDRRLDVLRRVAAGSSISQAAREVGVSYKAAWQALDTLSSACGLPLVERTVGGAGGGGARITSDGVRLLQLADELARARSQVLARFSDGRNMAAGLGLRTSMRNQLPCEVVGCEWPSPGEPLGQVHLRTFGGTVLVASLTRESADLLGLRPGALVLVMCKATAVRIQAGTRAGGEPGDGCVAAADPGKCVLEGRVERIGRGGRQDEVVLALPGGGYWVGMADHPFAGETGCLAQACMDATALVVGLSG